MYTAPQLTQLLQKQHQSRNKSELFRQDIFILQWRTKVGSFPSPDVETMISAGEPCGAWRSPSDCPQNLRRPEAKRNVGKNWQYFQDLPLNGYIPASGIRGLVRSWVKAQQDPELLRKMEELLGVQSNDTITRGKIEFFDAWPVEPTKLSLDIVNPQEPFQVFHQGQSTPLSLYTLGDGNRTIRVNVAIRGIPNRATSEDVAQVWSWIEQAFSCYGVGGRTASGYGSFKAVNRVIPQLEPEYTKKTFRFSLYNQGCAGPNLNTMELRPSHWRGWLRSWVLRFFLGVMSQENAQITVSELFGAIERPIEPNAIKGCVRLQITQGKTWGDRSQARPNFYVWKGKLEISAPKEILDRIILPIVKFAVSVGGVGRGWRRPLHIFHMTKRNGDTIPAARGTHLQILSENKKTGKWNLFGISPENPEQWHQTYQKWQDAVANIWSDRFINNSNQQLSAEVFAPHTCAIYAVPGSNQEPIDFKQSTWKFTQSSATRGDGVELIYQPDYKRRIDVGGNAAGGDNSHCSWASIKRVNVPHLEIDTDCQEIVCLFLGGTSPNSENLRARFLRDLHGIDGAVHLFGINSN
jgi:CRISPR-associated protein Cmr6